MKITNDYKKSKKKINYQNYNKFFFIISQISFHYCLLNIKKR